MKGGFALNAWGIGAGITGGGNAKGVDGWATNPDGIGVRGASLEPVFDSRRVQVLGFGQRDGTGTGVQGRTGDGVGVHGEPKGALVDTALKAYELVMPIEPQLKFRGCTPLPTPV